MKKSVSVVIPNYNGKKLLERNLPSVFKALEVAEAINEVIVVDDASTDDSIAFLEKEFPQIIILTQHHNCGFSPTINKGIEFASKDLVFLLNSDVELTSDYFLPLEVYFDRSDTFGVTGKTIGLHDDKIQDSGKFPGQLLSGKIYHYNFYINDPKDYWIPTLYLSGANALIDLKKLKRLGGFDEIFAPFYYEDTDLSIRAWRLGWRSYYEHQSVCRHPVSATIRKYHEQRKIWIISHRNKLILHALHLRNWSLFSWTAKVWMTLLGRVFTFGWHYHHAYWLYLGKRNEIAKSISRQNDLCGNKTPTIDTIMKNLRAEILSKKFVRVSRETK